MLPCGSDAKVSRCESRSLLCRYSATYACTGPMSRCGRNKAAIVPESVTSLTLDGSEFGSAKLPLLLLGSFVSSCAVCCL